MTTKLVRMGTCDELLLSTQPCSLLIFWLRDNQSAEFFKGTFPENSNIFETNIKQYIFISQSCMTIKLVRMDTCDNFLLPTQPCDLLIFQSHDNESAEFFKGTLPEKSNNFETN